MAWPSAVGGAEVITERCELCGEDITGGAIIGVNDGWSHARCYHDAHPPRVATDATQVISGMDAPVLARQLIADLLTPEQGRLLVDRYNRAMARRHACRIAPDEGVAEWAN